MEHKLLQLLLESEYSKNTVFYDEFGEYNYFEFLKTVNIIKLKLKQLNFSKQSNIAIYFDNRTEAIASIIAVISCGLVAVPISITTPELLLDKYLRHVDASAIIRMDDNNGVIITEIDRLRVNRNNFKTSMILFTSGTTGTLKAVELSESSLITTVSAVLDYMKTDPSDCYFIIKDYVHCSCLISEIFVAMASGANVCLYNPRLPFTLLRKKIKDHHATVMGVNPWILEMICMQSQFSDYYNSIRVLISSGSVLGKELKRKAAKMLPTAQILNVYGLTEACSRVCAQFPGSSADDYSVGKPIGNIQISLQPCNNNIYEILVKTEGEMLGYYNNEEATKQKIINGWIHTGDSGRYDRNFNLIVTGRIDDLIISAANKIDPNRVDSVIKQFHGIRSAFTTGLPDPLLGSKVVTLVEYNGDWQPHVKEELMTYCREHLLPYECPSRIIPVETFPRTSSGKINKKDAIKLAVNITSIGE